MKAQGELVIFFCAKKAKKCLKTNGDPLDEMLLGNMKFTQSSSITCLDYLLITKGKVVLHRHYFNPLIKLSMTNNWTT